jgi:small subunit ribosomal protein S17
MEEQKTVNRKTIVGIVASNKMDKTISVLAERRIKHPIYGKFMTKSKKFFAHDENNECNEGDKVKIVEFRPLSKKKRWNLVEILERAK